MDRLQQMMVWMAIMDGDWRTARRRDHRVMSIEELDALADYGWRWPDLKAFVAASANVVRSRWPSGSLERPADSSRMSAGS